ncbi:hypothetical protein GBAR_LOCUS28938, partial [Geodia barretti]
RGTQSTRIDQTLLQAKLQSSQIGPLSPLQPQNEEASHNTERR